MIISYNALHETFTRFVARAFQTLSQYFRAQLQRRQRAIEEAFS